MSSRRKGEICQSTDILEDHSHTFGMTNFLFQTLFLDSHTLDFPPFSFRAKRSTDPESRSCYSILLHILIININHRSSPVWKNNFYTVCHNFRSISNNPLPNYNFLPFFTKRQIWKKSRSFPWIPAPQSGRGQASREWQSKVCNIWKRISFVEAPMDSLFRGTDKLR